MKEIRLKSGYYGVDLICDNDGWYLDSGTYGYKEFDHKPNEVEIKNYVDQLVEELY